MKRLHHHDVNSPNSQRQTIARIHTSAQAVHSDGFSESFQRSTTGYSDHGIRAKTSRSPQYTAMVKQRLASNFEIKTVESSTLRSESLARKGESLQRRRKAGQIRKLRK